MSSAVPTNESKSPQKRRSLFGVLFRAKKASIYRPMKAVDGTEERAPAKEGSISNCTWR
jgi:hypothetical protein